MKIKVSDYIAERMADAGVRDVFLVPGGGAMHLDDAIGHSARLSCIFHHHEQAAAMAAEAYARLNNETACVCVTTGPGATNAVTGVLCAYMESIPMLVLSGQARLATLVRSTGLPLRSMGTQECDIISCISHMTKYSVLVTDKNEIGYHLDRALYLASHGRRGPVWLDIPLDVQGGFIETEEIRKYDPAEDASETPKPLRREDCLTIIEKLKAAMRPVLFAGAGIRHAGAEEEFLKLVALLGIPVVNGMSSADTLPENNLYFAGRSAQTGTRAGNFALQNADVLLSIGSRQSFFQTGFAYREWARDAYTILNDIDENELKKPNVRTDLPLIGDAKELIGILTEQLESGNISPEHPLFGGEDWRRCCREWKKKYPVVTEEEKAPQPDGRANLYAFYDVLSDQLGENENIVVSCGTSRVVGTQAMRIKKGQRFITNSATASMGYGLPAAIGVCVSSGRKPVTLVTGEGSLMMNLQELQTIVTNKLPIRIFVIENGGYHSIRQTQHSFFKPPLIGVGPESHDLSFPDLSKLAPAFGFGYLGIGSNTELTQKMASFYKMDPPCLAEVHVTTQQVTMPRTATRKLEDGSMVSTPLEDMSPFLSREELAENMLIGLTKEETER
ncbi:MAG TPA: thiamine pyrophosphate-binding protein [Lachnospiraceae bacterium]|nr:thiamine pyrophosphate-binding protein [Lachnospiraceae bacterium]